eukprot:jgi/Mesen1/1820/ME000141S00981
MRAGNLQVENFNAQFAHLYCHIRATVTGVEMEKSHHAVLMSFLVTFLMISALSTVPTSDALKVCLRGSLPGAKPAAQGWDFIPSLGTMGDEEFRSIVAPLAELCANAYRYPAVVPVRGWKPAPQMPPLAPPGGGAHALVYEEGDVSETARVVVAFRGTQLADTVDSSADLCADVVLWSEEPLPARCRAFSNAMLDYYTQSVAYVSQVIDAYPEASVLLTGHSLGSGLALLVSASPHVAPYTLPVVGFGSAGVKAALKKRGLHLQAVSERQVYIIADKWDEVMRTSMHSQVGALCFYNTPQPKACSLCCNDTRSIDSVAIAARSSTPQRGPIPSLTLSSGGGPRARSIWKSRGVEVPDATANAGSTLRSIGMEKITTSVVNKSKVMRTHGHDHGTRGVVWWDPREGEILEKGVPGINFQAASELAMTQECLECFFRTHYFGHILKLVHSMPRPSCVPAVAVT